MTQLPSQLQRFTVPDGCRFLVQGDLVRSVFTPRIACRYIDAVKETSYYLEARNDIMDPQPIPRCFAVVRQHHQEPIQILADLTKILIDQDLFLDKKQAWSDVYHRWVRTCGGDPKRNNYFLFVNTAEGVRAHAFALPLVEAATIPDIRALVLAAPSQCVAAPYSFMESYNWLLENPGARAVFYIDSRRELGIRHLSEGIDITDFEVELHDVVSTVVEWYQTTSGLDQDTPKNGYTEYLNRAYMNTMVKFSANLIVCYGDGNRMIINRRFISPDTHPKIGRSEMEQVLRLIPR